MLPRCARTSRAESRRRTIAPNACPALTHKRHRVTEEQEVKKTKVHFLNLHSSAYTMRAYVNPLVDSGRLTLGIPD